MTLILNSVDGIFVRMGEKYVPVVDAVKELQEKANDLGNARATLLINFGQDRRVRGDKYAWLDGLKGVTGNESSVTSMLVEVLTQLCDKINELEQKAKDLERMLECHTDTE